MSASVVGVPVAEGLFEWPAEQPRLLAGRCTACGTWAFPAPDSCSRCSGVTVEVMPLPRTGTLWSWTVQRFRPKEPYDGPPEFRPYGVGYVQFGDQVIVEGLLTESDPERLSIGSAMEVVVAPYTSTADGDPVLTYWFRPQPAERSNP